jgi:glutaredoxin/glutathione-dependent peroxiredoxin
MGIINVGTKLPDLPLGIMSSDGPESVSTHELFRNKKVALFAVPGAFTPSCSAKHLPGIEARSNDLTIRGFDLLACVSVNDVFVMKAWANHLGIGKYILMLSDGNADFVKAIGLESDSTAFGMGIRSQRFSMTIDNLTVTSVFVDEPGQCKIATADYLLENL